MENTTIKDTSTHGDEPEPKNQNPAGEREEQTAEYWKSKYEGSRKVNRDLESKLNGAYRRLDHLDDVEKQLASFQGKEAEYEKAKQVEQINAQAIAKANGRVLKAEIRAAASGRLTDPSDALRYLDLSTFEVSEDGEVDTTAIASAIDQLLETKPYLGKAEKTPTGVQIKPPSATRDGDRHKGQLTRDDLKTMSPEAIRQARAEHRLDDLLGINR